MIFSGDGNSPVTPTRVLRWPARKDAFAKQGVYVLNALIGALLILGANNASAAEQVPVQLSCSAINLAKYRNNPAFSIRLSLTFANGKLSGERSTGFRPGKEIYSGTVDENGTIKITSRGYFQGGSSWVSSFSGKLHESEPTLLTGEMGPADSGGERWKRDCQIAFLTPPKALVAKLGLAKPEVVQAQKQEPKTQAPAPVQTQTPAPLPSPNKEESQRPLKDEVRGIKTILGGIILPPNENPESWMLRVAAIPVQQQQFCRIIDRFYEDLAQTYLTRNEIKRNVLYLDRKTDMVTLLPGGDFTNWVVQIKEVTQAPDGSAAVMLQPPCRAMLGSDICQQGGKIRATIPISSSLYRELARVSAGDFVVVSGKILYAAETANPEQPLPTYAVYQAGTHCSTLNEGKQSDVFVTEIRYLVQLR